MMGLGRDFGKITQKKGNWILGQLVTIPLLLSLMGEVRASGYIAGEQGWAKYFGEGCNRRD
jgi:hypothetical protein